MIDALGIDPARLTADLDAVNRFGAAPGRAGIDRPAFSEGDMAARAWLTERLVEAGLEARMDGVGNVTGRWEAGAGPAVLAGSHLDSVPRGGRFDGALGTLAALEAVRAMKDAGLAPCRPVEVVCTADEEGRFGGMLGSQAITGEIGPGWIAAARDDDGVALADALAAAGLDGTLPAPRGRDEIAVFLELHIEQGPVLEQLGRRVGVVGAISGVFNWAVTLSGEANHSGTTPMAMRRDAFRGLADFGASLGGVLDDLASEEARLTVGRATLSPGYAHSIAGEASFSLVGRDVSGAVMDRMAETCREALDRAAAAHGLGLSVAEQSFLPPTTLDADVGARLADLAHVAGLDPLAMSCGAGHDAQTFARHVPAGLLLVPSRGGVSHAPGEWTAPEHVVAGATLLARAIAAYALDPVG